MAEERFFYSKRGYYNREGRVDNEIKDYQDGRLWQIRMSVKPGKDNIVKAMAALKKVPQLQGNSKGKRPFVKIHDPESDGASVWDATMNIVEQDAKGNEQKISERDQRGKEISIFVPYDAEILGYVFNAAYLEGLLLTTWKALVDAGVEHGYITPPEDEFEINTENGFVTPFCYSACKPWMSREELEEKLRNAKSLQAIRPAGSVADVDTDLAVRHGILNASEANPLSYDDPLQGLCFTREQLEKYGIPRENYDYRSISPKRITYQKEHLHEAQGKLVEDFVNLRSQKPTTEQLSNPAIITLEELAKISNDEEFINRLRSEIEIISNKLPRKADQNLSPLVDCAHNPNVLSPRETEISDLLCEGICAKQIANLLFISRRTVEKHIENIKAKLGCKNRCQLLKHLITDRL